MMALAVACGLAYAASERAAAEAQARVADGGVVHTVTGPDGSVEAVERWVDERTRSGECRLCLDEGLVLVYVDGVPTRLRCRCAFGNGFVDLTLPYEALFGAVESVPPVEVAPEPDRPEPWWDREAPEIAPATLFDEAALSPAEAAEMRAAGQAMLFGGAA